MTEPDKPEVILFLTAPMVEWLVGTASVSSTRGRELESGLINLHLHHQQVGKVDS